MINNIAVIGATGALGSEFVRQLSSLYPEAELHAFFRSRQALISSAHNIHQHEIDYEIEDSIAQAAKFATQDQPLDIVIVATGILHEENLMPEKSLKEINADQFHRLFQVNTVFPALVAKHFLPRLNKENLSIFAALSARVGSISDNHLGGWYAYRASKAALNMIIKNAAIEIKRTNKNAVIVGLHPGTVDSQLSKPFQSTLPEGQLFTPEVSVRSLLKVLQDLRPEDSGKCFAWDGKEITP